MNSQSRYDIVIVGGGMVGASLACALGETPLKVALVEAFAIEDTAQPSFDERTIALTYSSRRIFAGLDVWRDMAGEASTIRRIHISDRGRPGITRMDHRLVGTEALGYVVPTRAVGPALWKKASALPNIDIICPAKVTHAETVDDGYRLNLEHGGAGEESTQSEILAGLTVIADGGRSPLAELMGFNGNSKPYAQQALITIVESDRAPDGTAYERFTSSGPLALLPLQQNRYAMVWTLYPEDAKDLLESPQTDFLDRLQTAFGDRAGHFIRIGSRKIYPLSLSRVRNPVKPHAAIIGNAAHTVHPVAGQGFNLGLRDVAALAEVLALAEADGKNIGSLDVLNDYKDWRQRDTFSVTSFTDSLIRIFANDFLPIAVGRNLGLSAINLLPSAKRFLLSRTMGLGGRQSRLALGLPLVETTIEIRGSQSS